MIKIMMIIRNKKKVSVKDKKRKHLEKRRAI